MADFFDEIVREGVTFTSPTTMTLSGAVANHIRFRDAKRRDGNPVESGDRTVVGVIQSPAGRGIVRATLTLGAQDTLTLDTSKIYQSTAGASLPTFSSAGNPGEAYCTFPVPISAIFDTDGNLLTPDLFRKSILKEKIVAGFLSEVGVTDEEGVAALGVVSAYDGLGGFFAYDDDASDTVDAEDVFQNDHTSTGRVKRLSMKMWPTIRGQNMAAGNVLTVLDASTPNRQWLIAVRDATGAHRSAAIVLGHATDPFVDVINEYGSLPFELSGANLQVRNTSAGALTVSFIRPIIG